MSTPKALPNLRPLSLGELLDQAIRLYRRNFFKFIGIIAMVQIPITIIGLIVSLFTLGDFVQRIANPTAIPSDNPLEIFGPDFFTGMGVSLVVGIISGFLLAIAMAALTRLVADSYLGETIGTIEAYLRIEDRVPALIWTLITNFLFGVLVFVWFLIPCIGWLSGLSMLSVLGYIVIPLAVPVVVIEGYSGWTALRRAWELMRRRFWWVIGFAFILYLFSQLVVGGPVYIVSLVFQFLGPDLVNSGNAETLFRLQTIVQTLVTLVFNLLYLPLQLACMTLLYFDLRVRHEGLDLMLAAEEKPGISAAQLVSKAPRLPSGSAITWSELGYFVLLSIGGGVVFSVVFFILGLLGMALGLPQAGGF